MSAKRTARPRHATAPSGSAAAVYATRILVTSYFLLTATGLIEDPVVRALVDSYAAETTVHFLLTVALVTAALTVMLDRFVRPAALFLAVYLLWSAVLFYGPGWTGEALGDVWREATLFSALVLVATAFPPQRARLRRSAGRPVAPRRITPAPLAPPARPAQIAADSAAPRPQRPAKPQAAHPVPDPPEAEEANLFADLWDERPETRAAPF